MSVSSPAELPFSSHQLFGTTGTRSNSVSTEWDHRWKGQVVCTQTNLADSEWVNHSLLESLHGSSSKTLHPPIRDPHGYLALGSQMHPPVAHNITQAALVESKTKCRTLQMAGAPESFLSLRSVPWAFLILQHASYPQAWDRLDCTCKDEYQWKTNAAALVVCFRHIKESSDWVASFLLPRWLHTLRWEDLGLPPKLWGDERRGFTVTWLLLRL